MPGSRAHGTSGRLPGGGAPERRWREGRGRAGCVWSPACAGLQRAQCSEWQGQTGIRNSPLSVSAAWLRQWERLAQAAPGRRGFCPGAGTTWRAALAGPLRPLPPYLPILKPEDESLFALGGSGRAEMAALLSRRGWGWGQGQGCSPRGLCLPFWGGPGFRDRHAEVLGLGSHRAGIQDPHSGLWGLPLLLLVP